MWQLIAQEMLAKSLCQSRNLKRSGGGGHKESKSDTALLYHPVADLIQPIMSRVAYGALLLEV